MTAWLAILISVAVSLILLIFFKKDVVFWEVAVLIVPSALLILLINFIMVTSNESDTEYLGSYTSKVIYYEPWDEEVSCRHSYRCNCSTDKNGHESCSTCYEHAYDVDYHSEHWTKKDNNGNEYEISKSEYESLKNRFSNKTYFVELNRHYHSIDGNAYHTEWNGKIETSDAITNEHRYTNKVNASKSLFKLDEIDEITKNKLKLFDYPKIIGLNQSCVLGKPVDEITERKLQFINAYYGGTKQFRMYIIFFFNQPIDIAFKQRSYWQGGNKNEMIVCVGLDKLGKYSWCKAFSWMDKPELTVRVEGWFGKAENKVIDLNKFADWIPKQIQQHWHRKEFKDFDYLEVEISSFQLMWLMIIVAIYNIGAAIWIIKNEFKN